jgi:predicted outer membrane repeat protein
LKQFLREKNMLAGLLRKHRPSRSKPQPRYLAEPLESRYLLATFTVTSLNDSGDGSLRQAIADANANPDADLINFTPDVLGTITLTTGQLEITTDLSIEGPGADMLAVSGNDASRVFKVAFGATAQINGLTITGGRAVIHPYPNNSGGGIYNEGILTITNSTFADNLAYNIGGAIHSLGDLFVIRVKFSENSVILNFGGAIANFGVYGAKLVVMSSTFSGNSAVFGGAIYTETDAVSIADSTLSNNSATNGGGIYNKGSKTILKNSTLSGNSANGGGRGGGILNYGTIEVTNSTLFGNRADDAGGGIYNFATLNLYNSIVVGNTSTIPGPDISGDVDVGAYNLIGEGTGMTGMSDGINGNQVGSSTSPIDPNLGPLTENGGLTKTHALLGGSPALNGGSNALIPAGITTDQRGFDRIVLGTVDIGAFEVQLAPPALDLCSASSPFTDGNDTLTLRHNDGEILAWINHDPTTDLPDQASPLDSLTSLNICTNGGFDSITIDGAIPLPIETNHGDGSDSLKLTNGNYAYSLNITGGTVKLISNLALNSLTLAPSALLDLANNSLVVRAAPGQTAALLASLSASIAESRKSDGSWTGTSGITSSNARNFPGHLTGLVITPNLSSTGGKLASFEAYKTSDVIVMYSWNGDGNADRRIDIDDYNTIDASFLAQQPGQEFPYHKGDFNFDKVININDYNLIDSAFLGQSIGL